MARKHNPERYGQFLDNCSAVLRKIDENLTIRIMNDSCLENLRATGRLTVSTTVLTASMIKSFQENFSDFSISINLEKTDERGCAECWIVLYSDTFNIFADCDGPDV